MRLIHLVRNSMFLAGLLLATVGCSSRTEQAPVVVKAGNAAKGASSDEAKIADALAKLGPEDRKLAEAQRWWAIEDENRLGTMGTPYKVMVNDRAVFLCCKGCLKRALAEPDKTLAHVAELKAKAKDAGNTR